MFLHFWEPLSKRNTVFLENKAGWYYLHKTLIIFLCFTFWQWFFMFEHLLNIVFALSFWLCSILYLSGTSCSQKNFKVQTRDMLFMKLQILWLVDRLFSILFTLQNYKQVSYWRSIVSNSEGRMVDRHHTSTILLKSHLILTF